MTREKATEVTVIIKELITAIVRDEIKSMNGETDSFSGSSVDSISKKLTEALSEPYQSRAKSLI